MNMKKKHFYIIVSPIVIDGYTENFKVECDACGIAKYLTMDGMAIYHQGGIGPERKEFKNLSKCRGGKTT